MHKAGINCEKPCFDCRCLSAKRVAHAEQLSGVMSVSNDLLQRHIAFGAISKKVPSRVVYNAVPRHFTILEDNRPLRSPELHIRIGFVGRVEASKGIEVLLAACQLLVDAGLEELFAVKIAGHCDKAYQNHLDDRWRRVGADYLGVTVASTFMDNIDVLVVPSLMSEGLGNVAFEGMARGTAVIASNIGGLREVLDNGNAGWLVTPGDPATLAAKLASLIMDRQLLARQSFAGLTRAAFFSLERQMSEIHDFLRSVCAAK